MFTGAELLCAGLNAAWPAAPAQVGACGDTYRLLVIAQWFPCLQTIWAVCAMPDPPNSP